MLSKIILIFSCLILTTNAACNITAAPEELLDCLSHVTKFLIGAIQNNVDKMCKTPSFIAKCVHDRITDCIADKVGQAALQEIIHLSTYCCEDRNHVNCSIKDSVIREQRCFAADSLVHLADGTQKTIAQLQSGDNILAFNDQTKQIVSTPFLTMLDFQPHHLALFKQITTITGRQLSLTSSHLLLLGDHQSSQDYIIAKNIQSGMNIYIMNDEGILVSEQVANVSDVVKQGFMAPLTSEGTLIVNNIAASCYATINSHHVAHTVLSPMRWWYNIFGTMNETNGKIGVHWFANMLYEMTTFFMPSIIQY